MCTPRLWTGVPSTVLLYARSGYKHKVGFEGGQIPIQRRLPKFGFKNINRVTYKAINLSTLQELAEAKNLNKIGLEELRNAGFISASQLIKVLAKGTLSAKVDVEAHAFSKKAEEAIVADRVGRASCRERV